jgi:hypothetical protein
MTVRHNVIGLVVKTGLATLANAGLVAIFALLTSHYHLNGLYNIIWILGIPLGIAMIMFESRNVRILVALFHLLVSLAALAIVSNYTPASCSEEYMAADCEL